MTIQIPPLPLSSDLKQGFSRDAIPLSGLIPMMHSLFMPKAEIFCLTNSGQRFFFVFAHFERNVVIY